MTRDTGDSMTEREAKPCAFKPWFGEDYGARCNVCGKSKRGMMANIDLWFECKARTVVAFPAKAMLAARPSLTPQDLRGPDHPARDED